MFFWVGVVHMYFCSVVFLCVSCVLDGIVRTLRTPIIIDERSLYLSPEWLQLTPFDASERTYATEYTARMVTARCTGSSEERKAGTNEHIAATSDRAINTAGEAKGRGRNGATARYVPGRVFLFVSLSTCILCVSQHV